MQEHRHTYEHWKKWWVMMLSSDRAKPDEESWSWQVEAKIAIGGQYRWEIMETNDNSCGIKAKVEKI